MFNSISKGVNQLHRTALYQAIHNQNAKFASLSSEPNITLLVGTKNLVANIIKALFSPDFIIIYFTGLGRLYTDFGIFGRAVFAIMVLLSSIRKHRHFIVENSYDAHIVAKYTKRGVSLVNGSGLNPSLYSCKTGNEEPVSSVSPDGKIIGHMSRFGPSKCTDEIIKIIQKMPDDFKMIIAGKDIVGSKYSDEFYQLAKHNPNVEMLGFLETPDEVSAFFKRIDVFLYPSIREGLPITLLESIYHQVPFLTTNVAGCIHLAERFGFPVCDPDVFGNLDHHFTISEWGSFSPQWDDILAAFLTWEVEKQFDDIFNAIIKELQEAR